MSATHCSAALTYPITCTEGLLIQCMLPCIWLGVGENMAALYILPLLVLGISILLSLALQRKRGIA